ncbi:MAG: mRNA interferase MazF [Motiliproteus sp.]|jgi:mRNA interferase MazF
MKHSNTKQYIPERNDIVFIDFEPTKGKEIGKKRPALVLTTKSYNRQTGFMMCCPISTHVRGGPFEVKVDNLDSPSVVCSNLVQTMDWKARNIKFKAKAKPEVMDETLLKLMALLPVEEALASVAENSEEDGG